MTLTDHPPTDDTLSSHLAADLPDLADPDARAAWRIDEDVAAVRALRSLRRAELELQRIGAIAANERAAILAWAEQASQPHRNAVEFLRGQLIEYRMRLEDDDPGLAKTYRLPGGELVRRRQPSRLSIEDEAVVVAWLDSLPDGDPAREALKVTRTPLVSKLAKAIVVSPDGAVMTPDAEAVPGVTWVEGGDTYDVRIVDDLLAADTTVEVRS